ncbi:DUF285 domain-containing protein [Campylobacter jejuni]|nr:DUF285 domain-containing protein [Campylobacter jejuni]EGA8646664.1 DUF285 domain-containing protein [Campylobacter jejuni]
MPKYFPKTKEELKALVEDESIYLGDIDTSKITDMSELFKNSTRTDFSGIEKWNTSNVKTMAGMFWFCERFNQDISSWDVSGVENMSGMFYNCYYFNQPLGNWDVSKVKSMSCMFKNCTSFNQDISGWDVSKVEYMEAMFEKCPIDNSNKPDVLQNEIFTKAFRFTDEGDLVITLTPDFEYFLAENQIKNSQDFADKFSDTIDENRYFDIPRILCYKEDLKSTPFEDFDNEYFVFVPNGTNDLDSLSYAVSALNPSIQKDFLIEAMKTKIEEGEINKENLKENLENEIKYISEQIPIVFEGKVGEDTIEKLLKEKETIVLPNVTKYAKNSINEYFENEKVEILEELKKHFNHSYKNK